VFIFASYETHLFEGCPQLLYALNGAARLDVLILAEDLRALAILDLHGHNLLVELSFPGIESKVCFAFPHKMRCSKSSSIENSTKN